jgi:hypothetical protein
MPRIEEPAEPWRSFFADVDSRLSEDVQLHCCGGFVATQIYGIARITSDVDFLGVVPNLRNDLIEIGGKGSALHQKHRVYLDAVTVATPPENYEERVVPMFPGAWRRLTARGRSMVLGEFAQKTHAKSFVSRCGLGDLPQNANNTTGC